MVALADGQHVNVCFQPSRYNELREYHRIHLKNIAIFPCVFDLLVKHDLESALNNYHLLEYNLFCFVSSACSVAFCILCVVVDGEYLIAIMHHLIYSKWSK